MSDYSKFLSNLTDQLGLLPVLTPSGLAGLRSNLGNLRPAHKALMYVGAATVACVVLGFTVKSLKSRDRKDKPQIIKVQHGVPIKRDLEGADKVEGSFGEEQAIK
ncbi:uncharacterized protein LOC6524310 [Drosophila yakuba]|uniref:Uncharacterized protein n=1 Tax=Drosophila yakuba TaxID=7245 RepID=B4Q0J3_DROYA|nr:uncharacterized protein LOC6524310 [Drosophila yakuba]XP_039233343.1 uncharacterized protein LOC6524310 [Drosophila yakuba]EDX01277.1 uncharacterized protein Dyak_GE16303 [Drosophila yakuba]